MLIIKISVDAPRWAEPQEIKETIAQDLEKYGDCRVLSVEEKKPEQMKIGGRV